MQTVFRRRLYLLTALLTAWMVGLACSTGSPGKRGIPPELVVGSAEGFNVLLITLDSTRADHLGVYGRAAARTGNLDGLARRGLRFDDAVTVAPQSLPAHASILTGRYPPNHGVRHDRGFRLGAEQTTLAEQLRNAGYRTAAFVSSFRVNRRFGLNQGFDVYDDAVSNRLERTADQVTAKAARWLRQRQDAPEPFLVWVHYNDPHAPHASYPPPNGYDAEIAHVDSEIGRLLKTLTASDLDKRTLVVVTGDHGEALGDQGETGHGLLMQESTLHVPLILSAPAIFEGPFVVADAVVSVVDIVPTVLELIGLESDAQKVDGVSLLQAAGPNDRAVYVEATSSYLDYGWQPLYGLRFHGSDVVAVDSGSTPEQRQLLLRLGGERTSLAGPGQTFHPRPVPVAEMRDTMSKLERVQRHEEQGELEQALTLLGEVETNSLSREVYDRTASVLDQMGRRDEALEMIDKSLAARPSATMWVAKARLSMEQGRLEVAAEAIEKAIEIEADYGPAYIARGDLAVERGDSAGARRDYYRAQNVDAYRVGPIAQERLAGPSRPAP